MLPKKSLLWNNLSKTVMKLPNMGVSNARKMSVFLMNNKELLRQMIDAMEDAYHNIHICKQCRNFTSNEICEICSSDRNKDILCIVKSHVDMYAIESAMSHNGLYYILGEGFTPSSPGEAIDKIKQLIIENKIKEVILAFSASVDGSILSNYMKIILKEFNIGITTLGVGIPVNIEIDTLDPNTLQMALKYRKAMT